MELKEAMEAATAELDVRPGFVGDVMAGARRRHTRKLLSITAAVALIAGVMTGVVLTRSPSPEPFTAADARLTAATGGDLSGKTDLIAQSLAAWKQKTQVGGGVTEVSTDAHVFWMGNTPSGPAALVAQSVRVAHAKDPQTLVGLVHGNVVVGQEIVLKEGREEGIYRFGADESTYVVLSLGRQVFWSVNPVRGPDLRYSRVWWQAVLSDGVAVVGAKLEDKAVFVRADAAPADGDVTRVGERITPREETGRQKAMVPHPGLGWTDVMWASSRQEPAKPGQSQDKLVSEDVWRRGYVDYGTEWPLWEVRAWLPDGRFAVVTEANGELVGALYQPDGTFDRALTGSLAAKGTPVPVRLVLPDGQGTLLADRNTLLGPEEREHAWLAPPGTTQVAVMRNGDTTTVPL
ncbi:hypothetical protein C8D87_111141 [Lentzea atacamensis]|uniref:Uncharacterized protein n=1 Tax=Lentzea atacamensis TaxID=531938 RepID=A0ABX9DYE7_9PSEU|nr:hypothetical protein [Lentzea atacamensis]RAS60722.1 hypothetical protein C8D87_111141 [Lentzea atacamensis]